MFYESHKKELNLCQLRQKCAFPLPFIRHSTLSRASVKKTFSWVWCCRLALYCIVKSIQICRWLNYCKDLCSTSGSWYLYLSLRSWRLKPSSLIQGDNRHCVRTALSLSTDRILANETGICLLSFSLKEGLEDESVWVFTSWVGESRFSHSREKVVEYHSIAMARDGRWQRGKGRKTHGQENKRNGLDAL